MWGFNHLLFIPDIYTVLYLALAGIALILPFTGFAGSLEKSFVNWFSRTLYEKPQKLPARLLFVAVMVCLFTVFVAPTHFLGDGYSLIDNLASESGRFIKWSEKGSTLVLMKLQSLIGSRNHSTALVSFQIVSVFSGITSIYFFFLISEVLSENKVKRILIFLTSLLSGILLLFFGYAENYPMLWLCCPAFIYFGLRYIKQGSGLIASGIFLICGVIIHLQLAVFIPAYVYLVFCRGRGQTIYIRFRPYFWGMVMAIVTAGIVLFIHKYSTDLYFENIFLPLFTGKPVDPSYYLASMVHLTDVANQVMLLSPLIPLVIIMSIMNIRNILREKISFFLMLLAVAGLVFLFAIDPKLAMPRDWDLFSLSAFGLTLLLVSQMRNRHITSLKGLVLPITIYLFVACIPYLLINLNETASLKYIKYIINLDRRKSLSSLITLRDYYRNRGENDVADSLNAVCITDFPDGRKIRQAFVALDSRNIRLARNIAPTIKRDKFSGDYHDFLGALYLKLGDYEKALEESDKAIQLQRYKSRYYINRAWIYASLRQYEKSIESMSKAYILNSASTETLEDMATVYLLSGQPDSAIHYASELVHLDSTSAAGYYLLSRIYVQLKIVDSAKIYAELYLEHSPSDPPATSKYLELLNLIRNIE